MNYKKSITLDTKDGIVISFGYQGSNVVEVFIYDSEDNLLTDFMMSAEVAKAVGFEMMEYAEHIMDSV